MPVHEVLSEIHSALGGVEQGVAFGVVFYPYGEAHLLQGVTELPGTDIPDLEDTVCHFHERREAPRSTGCEDAFATLPHAARCNLARRD